MRHSLEMNLNSHICFSCIHVLGWQSRVVLHQTCQYRLPSGGTMSHCHSVLSSLRYIWMVQHWFSLIGVQQS